MSLLTPYKSHSSPLLWNDAPIFIQVFSLARSNSLFLHCFSLSVLLFLLFDVGNGGAFYCSVVSPPLFAVWVWAWTIWRGKNRYCVGEGHCPVHTEWLTLLRHSPWLWLVVLIWERRILANQITATGWSHRQWIFTQLTCTLFYCQVIVSMLQTPTLNLIFLSQLTFSLVRQTIIFPKPCCHYLNITTTKFNHSLVRDERAFSVAACSLWNNVLHQISCGLWNYIALF